MAGAFKIVVLICLSLSAGAQVSDTLFLRNGQILIGDLKGFVLGKVSFDADDLVLLNIKSNKVKTLRAVSHLYMLTTIHNRIYYTTIEPARDGYVSILIDKSREEIALGEIRNFTPLRAKAGVLWKGNVSAGYSYTRSSAVGRFNSSFAVGYTARKTEAQSKGSFIATSTDSNFTFENAAASLFYSYIFNARWRALFLLNYQHNQELGLARRYQEGLAAGLEVLSTSSMQGRLISGVVLSQEKSTDGEKTPTQVEVPVIFVFDFFRFRRPDLSLNITQSLYTGITEAGRFRQDGQLNLTWKIITDFSVTFQLYDNFDNRPPGINASKFDYGVVFGLSYEFSQ